MDVLLEAQKWACAPFIFKALSTALKTGLLEDIAKNPGRSAVFYARNAGLTKYAADLIVDVLVPAGFLDRTDSGALSSTKLGEIVAFDEMTRTDFLFSDDVNYAALDKTEEALSSGLPAGLAAFDPSWETIYPHLPELPEPARSSWFAYDHYHSDQAYSAALDKLAPFNPTHLVDIGGNTGRFTKVFLERFPESRATFVDLPVECRALFQRRELARLIDRISLGEIDWLTDAPLEGVDQADLYWMSQFLDCFSFEQAQGILRRTRSSMLRKSGRGAVLAVLEPIVDEQRHKAAELSLASASLYFAVVANGNSKFFNGSELRRLFCESGFEIIEEHPNLGISHTLFILKPSDAE